MGILLPQRAAFDFVVRPDRRSGDLDRGGSDKKGKDGNESGKQRL